MKTLLVLLFTLPGLAQQSILLRPNAKPDAGASPERVEQRGTGGVNDRAIMDVVQPGLTIYLPPKEKAAGVGVVIAPGGGYARLAIDKEGHDVARWLNTIGVAGFVLKYRLPGGAKMRPSMGTLEEAATNAKVAIEDAADAMSLVRENAGRWGVRRDAIGMMGFSAGGHLAAMMGMTGGPETRPDFLALIYPAIPKGLKVDASTPRTFLVHADDDGLSAGDNSARFYMALKQARVSGEMHIYSGGGHGFGIKQTDKTSANWPAAFESWLKAPPASPAAK